MTWSELTAASGRQHLCLYLSGDSSLLCLLEHRRGVQATRARTQRLVPHEPQAEEGILMYVDYFYFYGAKQLMFRKLGSERRSNGADDGIVMEGDGLFRIKKILQLRGVIGQRELVAVFRRGNI